MANEKTKLPLWLKLISAVLIALNVVIIAVSAFFNINSIVAEQKGELPKLFSYSYLCFLNDEIPPKYQEGSLLLVKKAPSFIENEEVIVNNSEEFGNEHIIEKSYALSKITCAAGEAYNVRLFPREEVEFKQTADEIVGSVHYILPVWGYICNLSQSLVGMLLFVAVPIVLIMIVIVVLYMVKKKRMRKYNEFSLDYDDGDNPPIKLPMPDLSDEAEEYDMFAGEKQEKTVEEGYDSLLLSTTALGSDYYNEYYNKKEEQEAPTGWIVPERKEEPLPPKAEEKEEIKEEAKPSVLLSETAFSSPKVTFEEGDEVVAIYDEQKGGAFNSNEFAPAYLKLFERQTLEDFKNSLNRKPDKYSMILNDGDLSGLDGKTKNRLAKLQAFDADSVMDKINFKASQYDEAEDEKTAEENIASALKTIEAMTEELEAAAPVEELTAETFADETAEEIKAEENSEEIPTEETFEAVEIPEEAEPQENINKEIPQVAVVAEEQTEEESIVNETEEQPDGEEIDEAFTLKEEIPEETAPVEETVQVFEETEEAPLFEEEQSTAQNVDFDDELEAEQMLAYIPIVTANEAPIIEETKSQQTEAEAAEVSEEAESQENISEEIFEEADDEIGETLVQEEAEEAQAVAEEQSEEQAGSNEEISDDKALGISEDELAKIPAIEELPLNQPFIIFDEPVADRQEAEETAEAPTEETVSDEETSEEAPQEEIAEAVEEEIIEPVYIEDMVIALDAPIEDIDLVYDYPTTKVSEEIAPVIDEEELTPAEIRERERRAAQAKQDVLISNMARMYYDINLANYND